MTKILLSVLITTLSWNALGAEDLGKCSARIQNSNSSSPAVYVPGKKIYKASDSVVIAEDTQYKAYLGFTDQVTLFIVEKTDNPKEMTSRGLGIKRWLGVTSAPTLSGLNMAYFSDDVHIDISCH